MTKYVGQSYKRKEDHRLLTGKGQFVADLQFKDTLDVAFVRSRYAHAIIKNIDISEAKKVDGVYDILTGTDITQEVGKLPPRSEIKLSEIVAEKINPTIKVVEEEILAKDRVIYVGQSVAVVIAENRYIAEDAAEKIKVEYESLPALSDPYQALEEEDTLIHPHLGDNVQASFHLSVGNVEESLSTSDHTFKTKFSIPRVSGNPIETRGVVATYDQRIEELNIWSATQSVHMVRSYVSKTLGLAEENIRVISPDIGGGFGTKGAIYPEEVLIPYLAMKYNRAIRWIEDRLEYFIGSMHSRDQIHEVEVGFQKDGTISALKVHFVQDVGAYNPTGLTVAYNTAAHMKGMYKIPHFSIEGKSVLTNKVPVIAYRGAGRPEAVFVMDRIIDMIADHINIDPVEVRYRNMIQAHEMPYDQGMYYRDGHRLIYDSGDFPEGLKQILELANYEEFRKKQKSMWDQGKYIGVGISSYIEGTGIGPFEGAKVRVDATGKVTVLTGTTPHGQSHETTLAQICADGLGVSPEQIRVKAGDTELMTHGLGTFASRAAVTAGSAVHAASQKLRNKILAVAAEVLETTQNELMVSDGIVTVQGNPDQSLSFQDIAALAKPGPRSKVPEGLDPGLEATDYFVPSTVTFSSGFHLAIVEVDIDTGSTYISKYIVVHDCGKEINPIIVEGQVIGGVAQGIGEAMYEEIKYDKDGQLITGTYMDYLLPTAMEVPYVELGHQEYLSTRNPMGIKGVGEGGAISSPAAVANAVADALKPFNVKIDKLPITPDYIHQLTKGDQ